MPDRPAEPGAAGGTGGAAPPRRGVLVLHGFTGTPYEVAPVAERLAAAGFTVASPCLPGHGTRAADLQRTTWRDWLAGADAAASALAARVDRLGVAGLSMGGLLGLLLAARRPDVRAVASLAAPLWLPWPTRAALRVFGPLLRYLPKGPADLRDGAERAAMAAHKYRAFPLRATASLVDLTGEVRRALPAVRAPLLVVHSRRDHTAPPASADYLAARVPGARVVMLERSFHVITRDVERVTVLAAVESFFQETLA